MTMSAFLYRGAPALPVTAVISDSAMSYSHLGPALAGVNQILPFAGFGLGPYGPDFFSGKKPILDFSFGTEAVEGGCVQVLLDLGGGGLPVIWRQWYIAGGAAGAAGSLILTVEHGIVVPSWQLQISYINLAAGIVDIEFFFSLRAV
jgi:hypothetical protein